MTSGTARLIAVDGVNGNALGARARALIAAAPRRYRGGISRWDASGVFEELAVAGDEAGRPSARTLLLLYAADLAFRLRWQIRPALADGRVVAAAPYVDTAVAFGRAAGIAAEWLTELFSFAPRPTERCLVVAPPERSAVRRSGFIEFGIERMAPLQGLTRQELIRRAGGHLQAASRRRRRRS